MSNVEERVWAAAFALEIREQSIPEQNRHQRKMVAESAAASADRAVDALRLLHLRDRETGRITFEVTGEPLDRIDAGPESGEEGDAR